MSIDDRKNKAGLWVKSVNIGRIQFNTVSGSLWRDMNSRCRDNGSAQAYRTTYKGCTVSEEFKDFQKFVDWHRLQIGYDCNGYHLDKDLLFRGNKVYGPEYCVLIPKQLNAFLTHVKRNKGGFPTGVTYQKANSKFRAEINVDGVRKYLGLFSTPDEAFTVYKCAKEAEARRWAVRLTSKEFVVDSRVITALESWRMYD